jgi:hypothetical protein
MDYGAVPAGSLLSPVRSAPASIALDSSATSTQTTANGYPTFVAVTGQGLLDSYAIAGDEYFVELPSSISGVIGSNCLLDSGNIQIKFTDPATLPVGTTAYSGGDEFLLHVSAGVGTLMVEDDEIPLMNAASSGNLSINILPAV